uniref:hypothetical protein n=1 Tax=Nonomuraea sp. CA-251285 TaxID=3240002 RepID=UPI003F497A2D
MTPHTHPHAVRATHAHQDVPSLRHARLALAVTLRDLHRYTIAAMQTSLSTGVPAGGHTACSRHLTLLTKRVTVMQIITDRVGGASWSIIAASRGRDEAAVRFVYEPMEAAWRAGSRTPWAPAVPGTDALAGLLPIEVDLAEEADLAPYVWLHQAATRHTPAS